jgi:hypothetical protein
LVIWALKGYHLHKLLQSKHSHRRSDCGGMSPLLSNLFIPVATATSARGCQSIFGRLGYVIPSCHIYRGGVLPPPSLCTLYIPPKGPHNTHPTLQHKLHYTT